MNDPQYLDNPQCLDVVRDYKPTIVALPIELLNIILEYSGDHKTVGLLNNYFYSLEVLLVPYLNRNTFGNMVPPYLHS